MAEFGAPVQLPNDKRTAKIILEVLHYIILIDVKVHEYAEEEELCKTIYHWNELPDETRPLAPKIVSLIRDTPLQSNIKLYDGITGKIVNSDWKESVPRCHG